MTSTVAVNVENVSVSFPKASGGNLQVLDKISFSVTSGEFVSILGPSGCGKTTLLHLVAGLMPLQSGQIAFSNGISNSVPCAVVFQDLRLFYWMTALQNVSAALRGRGVPRDDRAQKAKEYLAQVGLDSFGDYYPHELSGGMRQRVALARALATKAPVLLLDEPFSNLDPVTRSAIEKDLLDVQHRNALTVVMITHKVDEAVRMADRVIVLSQRPAQVRATIAIDAARPRLGATSALPAFQEIEKLILWPSTA